jgi:hypothetical protein
MPLDDALEQVRAEAGFEAIILTDLSGNIISAARDEETPPELLGALLDVALRMTVRAEERSKLATAGESTFFDWEGRQVICRWFDKPQPRLIVILSPRGKSYKRVLTTLVKTVQREQ